MPLRKFLIFAAADGLILQSHRRQSIQISYNDNRITPTQADSEHGLEAFGIIGLLTISNRSYLLSITRRQQVAQIYGKPIYRVTEVALTPLSSKSEAERAISEHASQSDDDETDSEAVSDDDEVASISDKPRITEHRPSTAAEDVLVRKGGYGRFAQKWFSRKGWTVEQRRSLGLSNDEEPVQKTTGSDELAQKNITTSGVETAASLLPKLLRTTQALFGTSQSFYFSYDYDLTRSLNADATEPLFFWNHHLTTPFSEAGQEAFTIPLIQGFVGQQTFGIDSDPRLPFNSPSSIELSDAKQTKKDYLLTLISRRSVKRAGLRYLRRGIDEEGNTANSVETEQILSTPDWSGKVYSFLQIRGSIPVYWSQTPFSFKPIPQLQHSEATNYAAFSKHFQQLESRYGKLQVANLVEKHGPEAIVGNEYEKFINQYKSVGFEWFDFHAVCRGMKFENVSLLMDKLDETLTDFGYTVLGSENGKKQSGVLRTNCMDCLDRTNVVQSASAAKALEMQLKEEGFDIDEQIDQTREWFNTLWADNGDAISRQYASSDAMKGDYTRTKKRNFQGALKDVGLSISRFYNGIVNDYFSQAAIDFLLGNATEVIFDDFESDMMSSDPGVNIRKMRQQAIEVSHRLVVEDEKEEFIGGWTLMTPLEGNTLRTLPFQECVLLLTDAALYTCRFDWNSEKVSSFERIDLMQIHEIRYGTYITSTLTNSQMDETRNVGLVVTYVPGSKDVKRVNTRTVQTDEPSVPVLPENIKYVAFKAVSARSAAIEGSESPMSEVDQIKHICNEIERMAAETKPKLKNEDIISLSEALSKTGIMEKIGYSLKRFVWA